MVMVATDTENCPVNAYKLYVSKLNPRHGPWYDNVPVGMKTEKFIKYISLDAKLSVQYTNHSIRATSITILDHNGVEARHMSLTPSLFYKKQ